MAKTFVPEGQNNENVPGQRKEDLEFVVSMAEVVISLFQGAPKKLVGLISKSMSYFGDVDKNLMEMVLSMYALILNKSNMKGKEGITDIGPYIDRIGEWLAASIQCKKEIAGIKPQELLPIALRVAFGTIFKPGNKSGALKSGVLDQLNKVHPFMSCIMTIYQNLKKIKEFCATNHTDFSSLHPDIKKEALKSLNSIMAIFEELFKSDKAVANEAKTLVLKAIAVNNGLKQGKNKTK